jgi:hypothetical protein
MPRRPPKRTLLSKIYELPQWFYGIFVVVIQLIQQVARFMQEKALQPFRLKAAEPVVIKALTVEKEETIVESPVVVALSREEVLRRKKVRKELRREKRRQEESPLAVVATVDDSFEPEITYDFSLKDVSAQPHEQAHDKKVIELHAVDDSSSDDEYEHYVFMDSPQRTTSHSFSSTDSMTPLLPSEHIFSDELSLSSSRDAMKFYKKLTSYDDAEYPLSFSPRARLSSGSFSSTDSRTQLLPEEDVFGEAVGFAGDIPSLQQALEDFVVCFPDLERVAIDEVKLQVQSTRRKPPRYGTDKVLTTIIDGAMEHFNQELCDGYVFGSTNHKRKTCPNDVDILIPLVRTMGDVLRLLRVIKRFQADGASILPGSWQPNDAFDAIGYKKGCTYVIPLMWKNYKLDFVIFRQRFCEHAWLLDTTMGALYFRFLDQKTYHLPELRSLLDSDRRRIRSIIDPVLNLQTDPLRLFRMVRLVATEDCYIAQSSWYAIQGAFSDDKNLFTMLPVNKIIHPLNLILRAPDVRKHVYVLFQLNVLGKLMDYLAIKPELARYKDQFCVYVDEMYRQFQQHVPIVRMIPMIVYHTESPSFLTSSKTKKGRYGKNQFVEPRVSSYVTMVPQMFYQPVMSLLPMDNGMQAAAVGNANESRPASGAQPKNG